MKTDSLFHIVVGVGRLKQVLTLKHMRAEKYKNFQNVFDQIVSANFISGKLQLQILISDDR